MSAQRFAAAVIPENSFGFLFQQVAGQDATVTIWLANPNENEGAVTLALVDGAGPTVNATDIFAINQNVVAQQSAYLERVVVPSGYSLWASGTIPNLNVLVYGYSDPV